MKFKSIRDYAYNYVCEKIDKGIFVPNEKIDVNKIVDELGMSTTPVREALIQLANEGIVEILPRRGFVVRGISLRDIEEMHAVIGCLEGFAASLAVPSMKEEHFILFSKYIDKLENLIEKKKYKEYMKHQEDFHNVYISNCGNKELQLLVASTKERLFKKSFNKIDGLDLYDELKKINNEHRKIVELFKKKHRDGVESYLREVHWKIHPAATLCMFRLIPPSASLS
jgi:DNA-binding GntR family transcriptional regulator